MRLNYSIKGVNVDREEEKIKVECWGSLEEVNSKRKKKQDRKGESSP